MSIRCLMRLLLALCCMCLSVVDHAVNEVRDFCNWMILRKPSKRSVTLFVCVPVACVYLSSRVLRFVGDSKQVQDYAKNMAVQRIVWEMDKRLGLDKEQNSYKYSRYAGEDVSFRCVIPSNGLDPNYYVLWFHKQDNDWKQVPSKDYYGPVYDYVDGKIHTQLDLINIDENHFNTTFMCFEYNFRKQLVGHRKLFRISKIIDRVHYIYKPAGSLIDLETSFISVESTKFKPPSAGYEINGVDFRQFEKKENRCSPFFIVALIFARESSWTFDELDRFLGDYFRTIQDIMDVSEMTVLPQPDREPLLDFNRPTKTWVTVKLCLDNHLHGVLQFYFNKTRYNDNLGEYETVKIYYPIIWILNPNGVNNLLNPADSLWKEGRVTRDQYDPNYIDFMKKKVRMMHSDDKFSIGVETNINVEAAVVSVFVALFIVIISSVAVYSLFLIERVCFFIFARSMTSKCRDRANDDRKDVYILCSEDGFRWTCDHVLYPLERRGVTAWIHRRNVRLGYLELEGRFDGVEQCRKIVIVLTPDFAVPGIEFYLLKNIVNMLTEGRVAPDNVLIIDKNGDQEQVNVFEKLFESSVISSMRLTEMTAVCSIHKWIRDGQPLRRSKWSIFYICL